MITLTEKRLQELERKISEYDAKLSEIKAKFDVVTFPKDLAELKDKLKTHRSDLDYLYNTTNAKVNEANENLVNLKMSSASHSVELQNLWIKNGNLEADIQGHRVAFSDMKQKLARSEVSNNLTSANAIIANERSLEIQENLKKHSSDLQAVRSQASNAQIDAIAALQKNVEHENNLKALKASSQVDLHSLAFELGNINRRLDSLPKAIETKSYDAEIAELRKDIALILLIVHSSASQPIVVPVGQHLQGYDEKIKNLETAIAELYTLLKKYQR